MDCDRDRGSIGAPLANLQRVFEGMAQGLRTMSALLPKADIPQSRLDVRFVPKADSCRITGSQQIAAECAR
jgi:hypothetical protein